MEHPLLFGLLELLGLISSVLPQDLGASPPPPPAPPQQEEPPSPPHQMESPYPPYWNLDIQHEPHSPEDCGDFIHCLQDFYGSYNTADSTKERLGPHPFPSPPPPPPSLLQPASLSLFHNQPSPPKNLGAADRRHLGNNLRSINLPYRRPFFPPPPPPNGGPFFPTHPQNIGTFDPSHPQNVGPFDPTHPQNLRPFVPPPPPEPQRPYGPVAYPPNVDEFVSSDLLGPPSVAVSDEFGPPGRFPNGSIKQEFQHFPPAFRNNLKYTYIRYPGVSMYFAHPRQRGPSAPWRYQPNLPPNPPFPRGGERPELHSSALLPALLPSQPALSNPVLDTPISAIEDALVFGNVEAELEDKYGSFGPFLVQTFTGKNKSRVNRKAQTDYNDEDEYEVDDGVEDDDEHHDEPDSQYEEDVRTPTLAKVDYLRDEMENVRTPLDSRRERSRGLTKEFEAHFAVDAVRSRAGTREDAFLFSFASVLTVVVYGINLPL